MADENTIMEMMEEMESYFGERDSLFQKREEEYKKRYEKLIRRENLLKQAEEDLEKTRRDLEKRKSELDSSEQELLLKARELKDKTDSMEENCRQIRKRMQEEQLRLNLFETRLQNESLRQETKKLRYGAEKAEASKMHVPVLPRFRETDLDADRRYRELKDENRKLKEEAAGLKDRIISELKKRKAAEGERQELFKILLETDPETACLFEERVNEGSVETGYVEAMDQEESEAAADPEDNEGKPQDPPGSSGGERSKE